MSAPYLILPFAIKNSNRETELSKDTELAAIACAIEAEWKKWLTGENATTPSFISKVYYPIWCVPQAKKSFLIDGMKLVSGSVSLLKPPDPEALAETIRRSAREQEQYISALRSEAAAFNRFSTQKQITIAGYLSDKDIILDLTNFLKETKAIAVSSTPWPESFLPLRIDKENAIKIAEEILESLTTMQVQVKGLKYANEVVVEETRAHGERLEKELHEIQDDFNHRISILSVTVREKTTKLEDERSSEISRMTKNNDARIEETLAEKQELEKQLIRLEQDKTEYEKRRDLRRAKKDKPGEARWNVRVRQVKKQFSSVKGKVKSLSDRMTQTQKETEKATKKLNERYSKLIDEEKMKIASLENSRDLKIQEKDAETEELQEKTQALTKNINSSIAQITESMSEIEETMGPWETVSPMLIGVPIYVAGLQINREKKYLMFAPVIAQGYKGFALRIGTAIGVSGLGSRIASFLRLRSKAIEKLVSLLREALENDKELETDVDKLAAANNLIALGDFEKRLKKGLEELENEGWIKPNEKVAVQNAYRTA